MEPTARQQFTNSLPTMLATRRDKTLTASRRNKQGQLPSAPNVLHPLPAKNPLVVKYASGIYSTLNSGFQVLDACGVTIIDHGNPNVQLAVVQQMVKVSYTHSLMHTNESAEDLASFLLQDESLDLKKAYFIGSGSEAMESAMKLAIAYHIANGQASRTHFVSRKQAYHGNTVGALSISTHLARRAPYETAFLNRLDVSHVSAPYAYRSQRNDESEEDYAERLVKELDTEFVRVGPHKIAAFVAETIGGSTAGCITPPKTYFEGVRRVCSKYGILLVLDEVMCGTGRTGTYFAFEAEGNVRPDIVAIGEGLSSGFLPIAATLVNDRVNNMIERGGGFVHGHTYQAHPVACAAALAVQKIVRRADSLSTCQRLGVLLGHLLTHSLQDLKYVGNIRGRGLFWAVEFVENKDSKQPLNAAFSFGNKVRSCAHDMGLAMLSGSGTANGLTGDHVILAPPLTVNMHDVVVMVNILKAAYTEAERVYNSTKVDANRKGVTRK